MRKLKIDTYCFETGDLKDSLSVTDAGHSMAWENVNGLADII